MLPSHTGNRQRRKKNGRKINRLYKPKIEYTADGFVVTTLYIKSLGKKIKRSHLLDYFSKYGNVQNVRIHAKSNCFGFVTFARAESASKALGCRSHKINGREVFVNMADSWHQEKPLEVSNNHKVKPVTLPIELTNVTGTYLMDLNDDCLYEILSLKLLNIMDLCSVAETCTRLKAIATRIFTTSLKCCIFNEMSLKTIYEMRRMLINFGSSITDLTIGPSFDFERQSDGMSARVLDLVMRYCSKTLESLSLKNYEISDYLAGRLRPMFSKLKLLHINDGYMNGDVKQLFSNCVSLVELKVINTEYDDNGMIFKNTFPKLERFKYQQNYDEHNDYDLGSFVLHHKGLKTFSIGAFKGDCSSLLPVIASNCSDLEKLQITGHSNSSPLDYVAALKSLLALKKLTKLKIKCDKENVTTFLQELPQLSSLEFLELWYAQSDANFILALSQLKNLKVLRLRGCNQMMNVNALADLENLTELSILLPGSSTKIINIEIDVIGLVKRLTELKKLIVGVHSFKVDQRMYLKLVNVIRERPGRLPSSLEFKAFDIEREAINLQLDGKNREFVKLDNIHLYDSEYGSEDPSYMPNEYSDSDFDPYFLDDDDTDDYDLNFDPAFLLPFMHQQIMNRFIRGDADNTDDGEYNDDDDAEIEVW